VQHFCNTIVTKIRHPWCKNTIPMHAFAYVNVSNKRGPWQACHGPLVCHGGYSSGKKCPIGTSRTCAMSQSREAAIRLVPLSFFWICWNDTPTRVARSAWVRPNIQRRARMRSPTMRSISVVARVMSLVMEESPVMRRDRRARALDIHHCAGDSSQVRIFLSRP